MNINDQKLLVIIAVLILLLLIGFLVIAAIALYFFIRKEKNSPTQLPLKTKIPLKVINTATSSIGLCKNHIQNNSIGICSICEEEFCAQCLKEIDKVYLCPEHLKLYVSHKWTPITNQKTTPDTPESGVYIYNYKKEMWDKSKTPSFILNEYKINMEEDFVETYVQLHVKEEDAPKIRPELSRLKDSNDK